VYRPFRDFFTCSLNLLASGTDLKSQKDLYSGLSPRPKNPTKIPSSPPFHVSSTHQISNYYQKSGMKVVPQYGVLGFRIFLGEGGESRWIMTFCLVGSINIHPT
jgi:hypothetical protein